MGGIRHLQGFFVVAGGVTFKTDFWAGGAGGGGGAVKIFGTFVSTVNIGVRTFF